MTDQNKPDRPAPGEAPLTETVEDASTLMGPSLEDVAAANAVGDGEAEPHAPQAKVPAATTMAASDRTAAGTRQAAASSKGRGTPAPAPGAAETAEQPRYIDDPVSKWWVILIVVVFALIFAWALLLGSNGLLGGGDDGSSGTPVPTLAASPGPSASAATLASAEPSVQPTTTPTAEASAAPTAEPSPEPTAAASAAPTPVVSTAVPSLPPASPAG